MVELITLFRKKQCYVRYSEDYDENWDDEELLDNIIGLGFDN